MKITPFILLVSLIFSCQADDFHTSKKLKLSTDGISTLRIDCGAGFCKITGSDDLAKIIVEADIFIDDDENDAKKIIDKYLDLKLEKRRNNAYLTSNFESSMFSRRPTVRIDLTIEVPEQINVDIDDGSGFITVTNLEGEIEIDDGSGSIKIEDIDGDVFIDDGSGEITIRNVKGDVEIDDGSGDLKIKQIDGNVRIDDGSGSIIIDMVKEDVIIEDAGSGSVRIRNVEGKVYRDDD